MLGGAAPRPSAPGPAGGRRRGGRAERPGSRRPCPGPAPERGGSRAGSRVPPAPSGARSRRAARGPRCSCGNCRLFVPSGEKGGKVGGRPGRAEARRGGEAAPVGPARGERSPWRRVALPEGAILEVDFSRRPKPTFLRRRHPLPFSGKPREGAGRAAQAAAPTACTSRTRGSGRGHPPAQGRNRRCVQPGRETLRGHEVSHLGRQLKNCSAPLFHPLGTRPCSELGDNYKTSNRRFGEDVVKNQQ